MIVIIEGPDGTGKTTLAKEIAKEIDGYIIHAGFNKKWDIKKYHQKLMTLSLQLEKIGINVILDRWAPSEHVYGEVFRYGPSYGTKTLIKNYSGPRFRWIMCRNDNVKENHLKNKEERYEMFDDMEKIQEQYDEYVRVTPFIDWKLYDFNKNDIKEFIKEIL